MPIYEFAKEGIYKLDSTTFAAEGLRERDDVQRLLREKIDVIAPDTLVIAEEFNGWDSQRRIDLLAIDKKANLVVIELKRTDDGGHMDLQAIRYAAMVSTLTFDKAVAHFQKYLNKIGRENEDSRELMLEFLGWDIVYDQEFAQSVKIVLASSDFNHEITSTVLWLNAQGIDIVCVRLQPYKFMDRTIVDVQQVIPFPEAADYQIKIREKNRQERQSVSRSGRDYTKFDITIGASGDTLRSLSKRDAIFSVVKFLISKGIVPDEIANVIGKPCWYYVEESVDSEQFKTGAAEKSAAGGPAFRPISWFCNSNDQLVYANGRTYAFSNQWGSGNRPDAMASLKKAYSGFEINYFPSGTAIFD
jgi:hypothetical protein